MKSEEVLRRHSINNIQELFNHDENTTAPATNQNSVLLCYLCIKVNTHKGIKCFSSFILYL